MAYCKGSMTSSRFCSDKDDIMYVDHSFKSYKKNSRSTSMYIIMSATDSSYDTKIKDRILVVSSALLPLTKIPLVDLSFLKVVSFLVPMNG